eukprot:155471-Chlamydomonas_euryale.AAC.2
MAVMVEKHRTFDASNRDAIGWVRSTGVNLQACADVSWQKHDVGHVHRGKSGPSDGRNVVDEAIRGTYPTKPLQGKYSTKPLEGKYPTKPRKGKYPTDLHLDPFSVVPSKRQTVHGMHQQQQQQCCVHADITAWYLPTLCLRPWLQEPANAACSCCWPA